MGQTSKSGTKFETTHKHRNLIDDLLDGAFALVAILYYFLSDQFNISITTETLALIVAAGVTVRGALRKLLMRLWGDELGITAPAEDAQLPAVASDGADSED